MVHGDEACTLTDHRGSDQVPPNTCGLRPVQAAGHWLPHCSLSIERHRQALRFPLRACSCSHAGYRASVWRRGARLCSGFVYTRGLFPNRELPIAWLKKSPKKKRPTADGRPPTGCSVFAAALFCFIPSEYHGPRDMSIAFWAFPSNWRKAGSKKAACAALCAAALCVSLHRPDLNKVQ
jgi:hypothetical protein